LSLSFDSLYGSLPTEVGLLTCPLTVPELDYVDFLSGTIPLEMSRLSKLEHLSLSWNSLSGSLPIAVGLLTLLTFLNLDYVEFLPGTIPNSEIGDMFSNLECLSLSENALLGSLLTSLGLLTHLVVLALDHWAFCHAPSLVAEMGLLSELVVHLALPMT
jgi:hypothetical protein